MHSELYVNPEYVEPTDVKRVRGSVAQGLVHVGPRAGPRGSTRVRQPCRSRTMPSLMAPLVYAATVVLLVVPSTAMCPSRCQCNDDALQATCVGAGLEVVPIQLNPDVKHINLTHNKITNVLFTLSFYTNLYSLDVSYNHIEMLGSKNFESQMDMLYLNISNNGITHLSQDTFKGLKSLIYLDLSSNKIQNIHSKVFHDVTRLEEINLSDNNIVSFEKDAFKYFRNLITLLLDSNQILDIPIDNLVYTTQLQSLSLSNNLIASLLQESLPMCKNLIFISLDNNVISDIHHTAFDGLTMLQHLDLNDNNLTVIPTLQLSKLSNLTQLSLSGNFFQIINPVSFQSLFQLKYLHMSRLDLLVKVDGRAFVDNIHLERIWMNDNIEMTTLPTRLFHGNPRLTHISMRNNAIKTLEATHFPLDQLQRLQLGGNPLLCNCSLLWLWRLGRAQEHSKNTSDGSKTDPFITLDMEQIQCAEPEHLSKMLLSDVPESEIRCSVGWLTILTIVLTVSLVFTVAGSVLYYVGAINRCGKKDKQSELTATQRPVPMPPINYNAHIQACDKLEMERYMMAHAQSMNNEYHTLTPWQPCNKNNTCTADSVYQQLDYSSSRPHIVYV